MTELWWSVVQRFSPSSRRVGRGLLVAAMVSLALAGIGRPAVAESPPLIWQKWLASLQAAGYTVTQGQSQEFTKTECRSSFLPTFGSCLGDSLVDPYSLVAPPVGGELVDPFYGTAGAGVTSSGTATNFFYQLDPTEAILSIVTLPPEAAYFSYQTYLLTRAMNLYPQGGQMPSPDPSRALLFASTGSSVSNIDILKQSGLGFGQGTVGIITTANEMLSTALVSSFAAFGGSASEMFTDPLGSNLYPGLGEGSDQFASVLRYSVPENAGASKGWLTRVAKNVTVFRIEQAPSVGVQLFGLIPLATKAFNVDESSHAATLNELTKLLSNWLGGQEGTKPVLTIARSSAKVSTQGVLTGGLVGPFCITAGSFCSGDEQDTDAYKIAAIGALPEANLAIVDGVDHTVTNNATYISQSALDVHQSITVAGVSQTNPTAAGFTAGSMTGSAAQALQDLGLYSMASPALIADLPNLYVSIFAHVCNSSNVYCTRSYTVLIPPNFSARDKLDIVERAYILPGANNGANPDDLLNPQVIH